MTHQALHDTIRSKFQTDIVTAGHVTHVVYDNEREAWPTDTIWIECNIRDTDTELVATGAKQTYRKRGEIVAAVRGPLQQGDSLSLRVCDAIRSAFNRANADGVFYGATSVGGFERDEQFWKMEAVTPFYQDNIVDRKTNVGTWSLIDREASFNAIRSRFNTLFGSSGSVSANTVIYDNSPTKPPIDTQWMNFSIATGTTELVGAGTKTWARTFGEATAMIMSPLGVGNQAALVLGDDIVENFRSLTDSGVVFETPYLVTVGRRGQWWQTNANIRFRLEEILT